MLSIACELSSYNHKMDVHLPCFLNSLAHYYWSSLWLIQSPEVVLKYGICKFCRNVGEVDEFIVLLQLMTQIVSHDKSRDACSMQDIHMHAHIIWLRNLGLLFDLWQHARADFVMAVKPMLRFWGIWHNWSTCPGSKTCFLPSNRMIKI